MQTYNKLQVNFNFKNNIDLLDLNWYPLVTTQNWDLQPDHTMQYVISRRNNQIKLHYTYLKRLHR